MDAFSDTYIERGVGAFFVGVALGLVCFLAASVVSRLFASEPKRVYRIRLGLMCALLIPWWAHYLPASVMTPVETVYYPSPKTLAARYSSQTIWIWLALAVFEGRRKARGQDQAPNPPLQATAAPPRC